MSGGCSALPLPDPDLSDGDVLLRPWAAADAPALAAAWADPEVVRWTGVPPVHDESAAARWITGEAVRRERGLALDLVIDLQGEVAGEVGLSAIDPVAGTAEVGWWLAEAQRGRKVASRAVRLVADWATAELCIEVLVARCDPANPASSGVARAAGFVADDEDDGAAARVWRFAPAEGRGTVQT